MILLWEAADRICGKRLKALIPTLLAAMEKHGTSAGISRPFSKWRRVTAVVEFNPAAALFTPACKPSPEKRVMSGEEVMLALTLLDLRERLIFRMAVFDGIRPGEIFAIQLGKIGTNFVLINQCLYGSNFDMPKGRKGKNTAQTVALSQGTMTDIEVWKTFLQRQDPKAYLFPSETGVTPLRPNNHWKRDIRPRLERFGLEWVNFQVLRRTNASLSRKAKVDDKVSADQRGHGLGVSLGVYSISDLDQKIEAVTMLESEVIERKKVASSEPSFSKKGIQRGSSRLNGVNGVTV